MIFQFSWKCLNEMCSPLPMFMVFAANHASVFYLQLPNDLQWIKRQYATYKSTCWSFSRSDSMYFPIFTFHFFTELYKHLKLMPPGCECHVLLLHSSLRYHYMRQAPRFYPQLPFWKELFHAALLSLEFVMHAPVEPKHQNPVPRQPKSLDNSLPTKTGFVCHHCRLGHSYASACLIRKQPSQLMHRSHASSLCWCFHHYAGKYNITIVVSPLDIYSP